MCRRNLGRASHRYAIAWFDILGTDSIAYGGLKKNWTPPRKFGGIPRVSTRFSESMENKQADAGRAGQTPVARPNSQARSGRGRYHFPFTADNEQDRQPYPIDPYFVICDDHMWP